MQTLPEPSKPLKNLTILVACSASKMVELAAGLQAMGGSVLPFPVIEAQEIEDKGLLDRALGSLNEYAWIIFTSVHGVRFFMLRLNERVADAETHILPKLCAVGPATAAALKEYGCEAALVPERYLAEGILEALDKYHGGIRNLAGSRVLLPRAREAREVLPETLSAAGIRVDIVPCYQTVRAQMDDAALQRVRDAKLDLMVFTSSSTIKNWIEIFGRELGTLRMAQSTVAVLGPVTAATAELFGKKAEIVPNRNTVAALIEAIQQYYSAR